MQVPMFDGATPVYVAAQNGHSEIVKVLVLGSLGADVNVKILHF